MNEHHEHTADGQIIDSSIVRRRLRRDASQWRSLIERHRQSGLSIRAFCRQQVLSEASFHAWRRRLREQALPTPDASAQFVRLQSRARGDGGAIEVRFSCGSTLHCSSDHLASLVRLLQSDGDEIGSC